MPIAKFPDNCHLTNDPDNLHEDEEFLNKLIDSIDLLVSASPQQLVGIKNTSSLMIYYSKKFANFLGIEQKQIIGKRTFLPLYDNPDIETTILNEDETVINERRQLRVLKINKVGGTLKPYVCIKSPLINPHTNNLVGILLQGFEISVLNLNQHIFNSYKQFKSSNANNTQLPHLTKREKQVIYFFMAQLTSQEIADTIYKLEGKKVSKSTIDSVFNDQLYLKFDVNSRIALFNKLRELGYDKLIPAEVLNSMSIPLEIVNIF